MIGYVILYPHCELEVVRPLVEKVANDPRLAHIRLSAIDHSQVTSLLVTDFLVLPGSAVEPTIRDREVSLLIQKVHRRGGLLAAIGTGVPLLKLLGDLDLGESQVVTAENEQREEFAARVLKKLGIAKW